MQQHHHHLHLLTGLCQAVGHILLVQLESKQKALVITTRSYHTGHQTVADYEERKPDHHLSSVYLGMVLALTAQTFLTLSEYSNLIPLVGTNDKLCRCMTLTDRHEALQLPYDGILICHACMYMTADLQHQAADLVSGTPIYKLHIQMEVSAYVGKMNIWVMYMYEQTQVQHSKVCRL